MPLLRSTSLTAAVLLAAAMSGANGWAQSTVRLESAEGQGAAECFMQANKQGALEFDPKGGLVAGVDNSDRRENTTVVVRLTFTEAAAPPAVEVLYAAGNLKLVPLVERTVVQYRLSCLPGGQKIVAMQRFVMYGIDAKVLQLKRELALVDLLRLAKEAKDPQGNRVRFDFATMACPFRVEFAPYRPYAANTAFEVGARDPGRRPFLEWLRNLTLDLPPEFMRTAIGSASVVTVPCTVLDLS